MVKVRGCLLDHLKKNFLLDDMDMVLFHMVPERYVDLESDK